MISDHLVNTDKLNLCIICVYMSIDAYRKSLTVILMFCSLWIVGISLILICGWRRKRMASKNELMTKQAERKAQSAKVSHSPAAICSNLQEYVSEIFPSVFGQKSRIHRLVDEVKKHHRYFNILTASLGEFGDRSQFLTGIQLLTIQTMLMFLLAVFYDLQCPSGSDIMAQKILYHYILFIR